MRLRHKNTTTVARPVAPAATATQRPVEKPVEFILKRPQAQVVAVAGSFNSWDTKRTPMRKDQDVWKTTVWLPPGRYEYRFIVDGEWINDPAAKESVQNPFGSINSIVAV
jgi:1,4-alpha-glucan branching enzyme